jgi:hypothetical protein
MASYDMQIERWLSKATFDALDKSAIPVGTEINIVGQIEESDLSLELLNKINTAGGHCFKIEVDTGVMWYGKFTYYVNTTANTLSELASDLIERKCISGHLILEAGATDNVNDIFGSVTTYISTATISGESLELTGNSLVMSANSTKDSVVNLSGATTTQLGTATITKLW